MPLACAYVTSKCSHSKRTIRALRCVTGVTDTPFSNDGTRDGCTSVLGVSDVMVQSYASWKMAILQTGMKAPLMDASLVEYGGRWWLLRSDRRSQRKCRGLSIFQSDSPLGARRLIRLYLKAFQSL